MPARIDWEIKAKAFHLYCVGLTQEKIAEEVGVHSRTIQKWIANYNWSEGRKELAQIALQNTTKGVKEMQLSIIKSIYALYAEKTQYPVKRDKLIDDLKISDVLATMKYELLLENLSTENTVVINSTDELVKELEALDNEERQLLESQENFIKNQQKFQKL
ncbi:MAG: hypothetical protein COT90_01965 [Candidatus Diapherotrites archaeon CG10_big_fil_rev_8_21_14_0_10_31_34]|nr:MAG: hypothetical protein COT90_01965 [Candidatus Diapherotrites archaeon CG10_big_fil_rev_8_21_14_0_10_31_34]